MEQEINIDWGRGGRSVLSSVDAIPVCCGDDQSTSLSYGHELWKETEKMRSQIQAEMSFLCGEAVLFL